VTPDFIEQLRSEVPELPVEKQERYQDEWKISHPEALLLSSQIGLARYFEAVVAATNDPKKTATFITSILMSHLNRDGLQINETKVTPALMAKLIIMVNERKVSMNLAKSEVFEVMYLEGTDPEVIVKEKGLVQMNDSSALEEVCKKAVEANPQSVADYKAGKQAALQFLVGKVMKETRGQADAAMVQDLLRKLAG
jgi:aspartyl-tRNA(Asn)/glutamyl-tRNA(Gln) amidotransferase subunit B